MNLRLDRRALFSLLARPFQAPLTRSPTEPETPQVAVIQGRHCLALTSFCAACVERCPVPGALQVVQGLPQVVPDACTGCRVCFEVCPAPVKAVRILPRRRPSSVPAVSPLA
jgi:Na+-translocating ferredoxin:NAD+ oxidoreductase RNF subunit RnfB